MGDPTGKKQRYRGVAEIGRTEMGVGKVVAHMVKRHEDHHKTAQRVYGYPPRGVGHRLTLERARWFADGNHRIRLGHTPLGHSVHVSR